MNEKSQLTKERLYSEEKKTGRAPGITKRWQNSKKVWRNRGHREKQQIVPSTIPGSPPEEGEAKDTVTR
jgi:hypothetical protein